MPPEPMPEIPYSFQEHSLLELALTHASVGEGENNERLEFLGDAVLDLIVADELYRWHTKLPEGDLTEFKAWVVSRQVLAQAAQSLKLEDSAHVGSGMKNRALPRSVLANLYEAVLGAVYLDGGFEAARKFALHTLETPLERVRKSDIHGVICAEVVAHREHALEKREVRKALERELHIVTKRGSCSVGVR